MVDRHICRVITPHVHPLTAKSRLSGEFPRTSIDRETAVARRERAAPENGASRCSRLAGLSVENKRRLNAIMDMHDRRDDHEPGLQRDSTWARRGAGCERCAIFAGEFFNARKDQNNFVSLGRILEDSNDSGSIGLRREEVFSWRDVVGVHPEASRSASVASVFFAQLKQPVPHCCSPPPESALSCNAVRYLFLRLTKTPKIEEGVAQMKFLFASSGRKTNWRSVMFDRRGGCPFWSERIPKLCCWPRNIRLGGGVCRARVLRPREDLSGLRSALPRLFACAAAKSG